MLVKQVVGSARTDIIPQVKIAYYLVVFNRCMCECTCVCIVCIRTYIYTYITKSNIIIDIKA